MRTEFVNAVGGTRVSRVQFGVPPNCHGMCAVGVDRAIGGDLLLANGSGRDARNNPRDARATQ